jgi:hypothetical protein
MMRINSVWLLTLAAVGSAGGQPPWNRHVIDGSLRGADGVRLADFNGDGLQDVVTGWEESGIVRLYLNPGSDNVKAAWPAVTVGKAASPEDAVAFDVDGDGKLDVVSSHEGKTRRLMVHWAAADSTAGLLQANNWSSDRFERLDGQMWMFAEPVELRAGRRGLLVGSKGSGASITLLIAPDSETRKLADWRIKPIRDAGWIMTLKSLDMDGDGDQDIVFSDRKGGKRAVGWLEQPDDSADSDWQDHVIGATDHEAMFIDASPRRVLVSTRNSVLLDFQRQQDGGWRASEITHPAGVPFGKAIKRLPGGRLVMTSNTAADKRANPKLPGIWLRAADQSWHVIDPTAAVKMDRIECLDLDGDGDLDVMTCEERKNLGVIWYENPGVPVDALNAPPRR